MGLYLASFESELIILFSLGDLIMQKESEKGENSFWHLAIQNYYPKILNFVYYLTRDYYLAEDIAQETFAKAIDKFHQLKDPNKLFSWLVSIALNLVKTYHKTKQRIVAVSGSAHVLLLPQDESLMEKIEHREMQKLVKDAIALLSPQQQEIIIMRYYLDMKEEDIAFALKITIGTVKKQLFRARSKLHNNLGYLAEEMVKKK